MISKILWGIALDLQEAIKDKLNELDIRFTSDGIGSVSVTVDDDGLVIKMNGYLEFIEYGMPNPTTPEELESWVDQKMLSGYQGKNRDRAIKKISENLAEKITLFGPRPNPFLRPVLHTEMKGIIERNVSKYS